MKCSASWFVLTGVCCIVALATTSALGAVVYDNGEVQGTLTDVSDPETGSVAILVTDDNLEDNVTLLQFDKTFLQYIEGECDGTLPPTGLPLLVEVRLPSAGIVGAPYFDLQFSDELIRNSTCTPWWDFEWLVLAQVGELGVEFINEPDPTSGDFFTMVDGDAFGGRFYGGVWPNDGLFHTLFQSLGDEPFTLRVTLPEEGELVFLIKERPSIPEPASLVLLGCGAVVSLLRRRRGR